MITNELREGSVAQTLNTWMTPGVGSSPTAKSWCHDLWDTSCAPGSLGKALYSNCSLVWRSRKAVGPVYMYLNINTSVHDKERHRLFEKSRGSSRHCRLYFKLYCTCKFLTPFARPTRHNNSKAFQRPRAKKDCYKNSFFPRTISEWNLLPETLINSSTHINFKQEVTNHLRTTTNV